MINTFTYLDNFPKIPAELLPEVYLSPIVNPNIFTFKNYDNYKVHTATDKLKDFVSNLFPKHDIQVQIIHSELIIHKDFKRKVAINYLLDSGGSNVETCFYNEKRELVSKVKIQEHRWHRIDVSKFHNVIGLESPRIAISINPWTA
jgi:hypothetical protein